MSAVTSIEWTEVLRTNCGVRKPFPRSNFATVRSQHTASVKQRSEAGTHSHREAPQQDAGGRRDQLQSVSSLAGVGPAGVRSVGARHLPKAAKHHAAVVRGERLRGVHHVRDGVPTLAGLRLAVDEPGLEAVVVYGEPGDQFFQRGAKGAVGCFVVLVEQVVDAWR